MTTSDLGKRLRERPNDHPVLEMEYLMDDAADRLEALEAEHKRLQEALVAIQIKLVGAHDGAVIPGLQDFVRAALREET